MAASRCWPRSPPAGSRGCQPQQALAQGSDRGALMGHLDLLHRFARRVQNADLMVLGAPVHADMKGKL